MPHHAPRLPEASPPSLGSTRAYREAELPTQQKIEQTIPSPEHAQIGRSLLECDHPSAGETA